MDEVKVIYGNITNLRQMQMINSRRDFFLCLAEKHLKLEFTRTTDMRMNLLYNRTLEIAVHGWQVWSSYICRLKEGDKLISTAVFTVDGRDRRSMVIGELLINHYHAYMPKEVIKAYEKAYREALKAFYSRYATRSTKRAGNRNHFRRSRRIYRTLV